MISGGDEMETGHKELTFNLTEITKGKAKDGSGWQDAPGAPMLLCWKGLLSCGVGAIRDWTIDWGRVQAQQLIHEVFSAHK